MTREEHLQWCKDRALAELEGPSTEVSTANAFASFQSDMRKHEQTQDHPALGLMTPLYMAGHLSAPHQMRKFIEDFN